MNRSKELQINFLSIDIAINQLFTSALLHSKNMFYFKGLATRGASYPDVISLWLQIYQNNAVWRQRCPCRPNLASQF